MGYTLDFVSVKVYDDYDKWRKGTAKLQADLGAISWPISTINRSVDGIDKLDTILDRLYTRLGPTEADRKYGMKYFGIDVALNYKYDDDRYPDWQDITVDEIAPPIAYGEYANNDLIHLLELSGIRANRRVMVCEMVDGTVLCLARTNTLQSPGRFWYDSYVDSPTYNLRNGEGELRGAIYDDADTNPGRTSLKNGYNGDSDVGPPTAAFTAYVNNASYSARIAYDPDKQWYVTLIYYTNGTPTGAYPNIIGYQAWTGGLQPPSGGPDVPDGGGGDEVACINVPGVSDLIKYKSIDRSTGMVALLAPSEQQIYEIAGKMWSESIWDSISKIIGNLGDIIISLMIVPVPSAAIMSPEGVSLHVGWYDTGVIVNRAVTTYEVYYGPVLIEHKYNNYLDYAPYTSAEIYLPYVGYRPLDINRWIGREIGVHYIIDTATGIGVCYVTRTNDVGEQCVGMTCECNVGRQVPITSADYNSMIASAGRLAVGVGMVAAGAITGGVSATLGAGQIASEIVNTATSGNMINTQQSGSISANAAQLNVQYPYVVLNRPIWIGEGYDKLNGYPDAEVTTVGAVRGYAQYYSYDNTVPCTIEEREMINAYLRDGIYNNMVDGGE